MSEPLFRNPHRVAFYEVDVGGGLFGGRIYEFFVGTFHEYLTRRGYDMKTLAAAAWHAPIVHLESDFSAPMRFGANLVIELVEIKAGGSSMTISYRIVSEQNANLVHCTGKMVHVFVDRDTHKKVGFPDDLSAALGAALTRG
jgi:YbgC/YbaW family acyl-CoA thioester hydrolase